MKPFRKNVAVAVDGGGLRGIIVTQALAMLEAALGQPVYDIFRLAVGTSTGSIISAGIAAGVTAEQMAQAYLELGRVVFPNTWRKALFPLTRYRYPVEPFHDQLTAYFGGLSMGDFWQDDPPTDLVITTYDLVENRTRFVKPYKPEYADWPVVKAVQASCTVPTYFPVVEGRFVDGGVGSYGNPCYVAAYELAQCLHWDPAETTLISFGAGRDPYSFNPASAQRLWGWDWISRIFGVFMQSAGDQQVNLVDTFFKDLDFRRFQIDLRESIDWDDASQTERLVAYGQRLGRMLLNDQTDRAQGVSPKLPGDPVHAAQ